MPKCKILDNHMCITVDGAWRPCCRFNENVQEWHNRMKVNEYSFAEYKTSKFYQSIIEANKNGWHKGCQGCKVAEETGNNSTRLTFNDRLSGTPDQIEYIEISLSNECNLACKMCGPWASSTWNQLVEKHSTELSGFQHPVKKSKPVNFEKIINSVDMNNVTSIKLLGGEPFITSQTTDFFKFLDQKNLLGKITLMTNTNGTFFPKKMLKYLHKVRSLSLAISIDGIDTVNDYIRYKNKWKQTLSVIDQWKEFHKDRPDRHALKFSTVVNAYNVHQLNEIVDFSADQQIKLLFNIINGPAHLRLDALPLSYINIIQEKFKDHEQTHSVYRYFQTMKHNTEQQNRLKVYTSTMDKITGMKLSDCNSLLAEHLGI